MRKMSVTADGIVLPSMGDNLSWSIYVESFGSFILGIIVLFKPSAISVQSDTVLQMVIPVLSIVLVFALQTLNIWRNTSMKKAAIQQDTRVTVMSKHEYHTVNGSIKVAAAARSKI